MAFSRYAYYLKSIITLLTKFENPWLMVHMFTGMGGAGIKQVKMKENGLSFYVRGPMDVWCLKETYLDRFYEIYGVKLQDGWTVVDIGAGLGDYSILAAHHFPNNQVYAFEPFKESFTLLERNLTTNHINNVQIFQQAVGRTGALILDLSGGEPLQIQSRQAQAEVGNAQKERTIEVTSLSLNEVFVQNGIRRCDLLKMDCEGAEYDILLNAKPEAIERIQHLVLEYHEGIEGHSYRELVDHLQGQGFTVRLSPNPVHAHLGYLYAFREQD